MQFLSLALAALTPGLLFGSGTDAGDKKGITVTLGALKSVTPSDWTSQSPANKFRAYQFKIQDAELVIFFFGEGSGGSTADNIKRWKGQFVPPEGKTIDEASKVESIKLAKAELTYLDVRGTYLYKNPPFDPNAKTERRPHYRRLGVVFGCEGGPYFITLTGPAKTVEQTKKSFDDWLKNFK